MGSSSRNFCSRKAVAAYERQPSTCGAFARISFLLFCVCVTLCLGCAARQEQVSREALHNTKVWILERYPQVEHPQVRTLFSRILARLDANNYVAPHPDPRVYVVQSADPALFSLCDGSIFISSSSLLGVQSAAELSALIAHELAHVRAGDACTIQDDFNTQADMEVTADKHASQLLARAIIDPHYLLQAVRSLPPTMYRSEEESFSEKSTILSRRIEALSERLQDAPRIETKVPEERQLRKVRALFMRGR